MSEKTPLEQFREDCHDILKKLDCWGTPEEVIPFVEAMLRYQVANNDQVLKGYLSAFATFQTCWESNGVYAQKIRELYDLVKADTSNAELKADFQELFSWLKDEEWLAQRAPSYYKDTTANRKKYLKPKTLIDSNKRNNGE